MLQSRLPAPAIRDWGLLSLQAKLEAWHKELPLLLPEAATAENVQQPDNYHIIGVDQEGGLYLDGVPVGLGQLQRDVRNLAATDPEVKIRLDVDRDATFNDAMAVMDMLRFEKLNNVGINTRKRDERGY